MGKTAEDIRKITIRTHEACLRIIDKKGPLSNPADRDHCVQYMIAIPLIFGRLTAADYEDQVADDPRIDAVAGEGGVRGGTAIHAGLSRSGEAFDCELAARGSGQRGNVLRRDGGVSDRAQAAARGRDAAAGGEVQVQPGAAIWRGTAAEDSGCIAGSRTAGADAGERVRGFVRGVNSVSFPICGRLRERGRACLTWVRRNTRRNGLHSCTGPGHDQFTRHSF